MVCLNFNLFQFNFIFACYHAFVQGQALFLIKNKAVFEKKGASIVMSLERYIKQIIAGVMEPLWPASLLERVAPSGGQSF